jgi:protein required for attachment to host cells
MTYTLIPHAALVVVGDGAKARFFRNEGNLLHPKLVVERAFEQENPPTHEQGTDAPGRYMWRAAGMRSAVEQTDWHRLAEDRFAHEISTLLYKLAHANAFQELIVVAPPKVLGGLRESFHQEVARRVIAEIPKDLTGRRPEDIARVISG